MANTICQILYNKMCLNRKETAAVQYRWQIADCFLTGYNEISKLKRHIEKYMCEQSGYFPFEKNKNPE